MPIKTLVTRGYGNGTFNSTIALVVTKGYAIGDEPLDILATQVYSIEMAPENREIIIGHEDRRIIFPSVNRSTKVSR